MSSGNGAKLPELPRNVEKLLVDMPVGDRDWDALALRTVEQAMLAKETPASLLDPPLPAVEGEAGFERKEPARDGEPVKDGVPVKAAAPVSLAELARASVKKKTEATKDIALESLAVATQARAQVEEIAERVQAAARQARTSTPEVEEAPPASAERATAKTEPPKRAKKAAAEAAPPPPASVAPQAQPSRGPWIVAGFAVLAAAAAIAIAQRPSGQAPLVANEAVKAPVSATTQPSVLADPGATAAPGAPAGAEPQAQAVAELAPEAPRAVGAPAPHAPAAKGGASPAAPPVASGVKPESIVLEDEEPAPQAPAAPPPASAKMVPAELPRGGMPDKPSAGAAYAAIGPFMGSARACVAGHDEASTARIVFSSDGSVQSVSVSGPASGTPAAACIQNALKKARVQPFASPTFTMSAPVRPQ